MEYSVLVVDDETLIAKNIAKSIERINPSFHVVSICTNGEEAVEYIKEHNIDVVFTDIRMPEMDGLGLAAFLSENYPYIECVIISGYDDFEYARSALIYHVKNYLLKPVNKEELKTCLLAIERHIQASFSNFQETSFQEKEKKAEEIVSLIKEYIQQNYQEIIDLSTIAAKFGFSSSYLTKISMRYEGITPSKYIKQYRISIAKQLLKSTDMPVSIISSQTGFSDQFHFSKIFKNVTGISPSQYRNQI